MKLLLISLCVGCGLCGCSTKLTPAIVHEQSEKIMEVVIQKRDVSGVLLGIPVLGMPGFLYSPHEKYKGIIDAKKCVSGDVLVCPFTGKPFLVP